MHASRRAVAALAIALLALALPAAAAHAAAPKRIVTIEWDNTEDVMALGITPVGIADAAGMRTWTAIDPPKATDVGSRTEPSIERIASLRPDLIITTKDHAARNLKQLQAISKVLVIDSYTGQKADGAQYKTMVAAFRKVAAAVGRRARGEAVIRSLEGSYATMRTRLRKAGRAGDKVVFAYPGGTLDQPMVQLATDNGVPATILRRLGLRNGWDGAPGQYGFTMTSPEGLAKLKDPDWVLFSIPDQYMSGLKKIQSQSFYKKLGFVKRNRFRLMPGDTWIYGGPLSAKVLAERVTNTITKK